jgi:hypothetical protein
MANWWPWLLMAVVVASGALVGPSPTPPPRRPTTLVEAVTSPPATLDPALVRTLGERTVAANVFQTLLTPSPSGVAPGLAQSWEVSGNVVTLHLNPRARLTNGQPLTAAVVAQALARPLWPSVASGPAKAVLGLVVGSDQVARGSARTLSGVAALGRETVAITLKNPPADPTSFLRGLAEEALAVVPPEDLLQGGPNWQLTNLWGSGGWQLEGWQLHASLAFRSSLPGVTWEVKVENFGSPALAAASVANNLAQVWSLEPSNLKALSPSELAQVHFVPDRQELVWSARLPSAGGVVVPVQSLARAAFRDKVPVDGIPATVIAPPGVLAVEADDPWAVALGQAIAAQSRGALVMQRWTAGTPLPQGTVAYLGPDPSAFPSGVSQPLMEEGGLFMWSSAISGVGVFPNGLLNWAQVAFRP